MNRTTHDGLVEYSDLNKNTWVVVWKADGTAEFRDCLISFGLTNSPELAMQKVEEKLKSDPFWAKRFAGGVFYPMAAHWGVPGPKRSRNG